MSIIVPNAYALAVQATGADWKPVIGWQSWVTSINVEATNELEDYPASNLGNPDTRSRWQSAILGTQYITSLFLSERSVDYIGIARHNWGTGQAIVSIEGLPFGGDAEVDEDWVELVPEAILADDRPYMWRIAETYLLGLRIKLQGILVEPRLAVLKAGKLLVLDRGLPPGHQPISYAKRTTRFAPYSISGDYQGTVTTTVMANTTIEQYGVDPVWYRQHLEPLRQACENGVAFFWAWAPRDFPEEVSYCWPVNDPMPSVQSGGYIDIVFEVNGLAI